MAKIEIEVYKGQTIFYDDNADKFVCDITKEDKSKSTKRGSLSDLRNEIDQFIKLNLDFKPFKFLVKSNYENTFVVGECTAIRKTGELVCSRVGYGSYHTISELKNGHHIFCFDNKAIKRQEEIDAEFEKAKEKRKEDLVELAKTLVPYDFSKLEEAYGEIKNG